MTLSTSHAVLDTGHVADHNAIAAQVNTNTSDIAARITASAAAAAFDNTVVHGATAATARPTGATLVHWVGSVAPTNAAINDHWTDTTNKAFKYWDGAAWQAVGSAASTGLTDKGAWTTGTVYAVNDVVTNSNQRFAANTAHTAGATFVGDAAKWTALDPGTVVTSVNGQTGTVALTINFTPASQLDTSPVAASSIAAVRGIVQINDADSISPQTDASSIASWPDDSGNSNTPAQGTGANQPILKTNQVNGHSVVRFTGGNWWLSNTYGTALSAYSVYWVGKPANGGNFSYAIGGANLQVLNDNVGRIRFSNIATAIAGIPGHAVWRLTYDGTTTTLYRNGLAVASAAGGGTIPALYLGQNGSGAFFSDWDIAKVVVANVAHSQEEAAAVESLLGAKYGLVTRQSLTVRARTDSTINSQPVSFVTPESYIAGGTYPLVVFAHGASGGNTSAFESITNPGALIDGCLSLGCIIASTSTPSDLPTAASLAAFQALIASAQSSYSISKIILVGQSLGGLSSLNLIAQLAQPKVVGWLGIYPVTSLDWWNANGHIAAVTSAFGITQSTTAGAATSGTNTVSSNATYPAGTKVLINSGTLEETMTVASVTGAGPYTLTMTTNFVRTHGSGTDISDYGTKTAGYDPLLYAASAYGNKRYRMYASTGDTTVNKAANTDAFRTLIAGGTVREAVVVPTQGNHGDASNFQPRDQVQFILRCLNDPVIT